VLHDPSLPEDLHGPEGLKRYAAMSRRAFPDARVTVEDQIAGGDKVVDCWTASGTHTGDFLGIPPTNRRIEISGITISRFAGGKIVEDWYQSDDLGMMQQLGVIPSGEASEESGPT
jgi:predicted ester cyclase